jgi:hypothetical protein
MAPSAVDEVFLCANRSFHWPRFSRLAAYRLPLTLSLAAADTAVVTVAGMGVDMAAATLPTLGDMVPVATSEVDIAAVAFSRADMAAVSGTADGGAMALVRAGNGRTLTASTCGSVPDSQLLPVGSLVILPSAFGTAASFFSGRTTRGLGGITVD